MNDVLDQIVVGMLGYYLVGLLWFLACYLSGSEIREFERRHGFTPFLMLIALAALAWMPIMIVGAWQLIARNRRR